MELHQTVSIALANALISFGFRSCKAYLNEETAGTLELAVFCDSTHAEAVAEHLTLHIPRDPRVLGRVSSRFEGRR